MKDDIAEVERLELGITIPPDEGFLFLFSIGWRKGLFYDYGPILPHGAQLRKYDVLDALGRAYCHVLFQSRFSITEKEWGDMFAAKWFPFSGLSDHLVEALINHVRSGWDPDEKLDEIVYEVKSRATEMMENWRNHSSFSPHLEIVQRAVERFLDGDYISCTATLFPRIEGILRTHHTSIDSNRRATPNNLIASAVANKIANDQSLFLPRRFAGYLHEVYFANFDPRKVNNDVSRHTIAHGVAHVSELNQKSATISILIIHQLFFSFKNDNDSSGIAMDVTGV